MGKRTCPLDNPGEPAVLLPNLWWTQGIVHIISQSQLNCSSPLLPSPRLNLNWMHKKLGVAIPITTTVQHTTMGHRRDTSVFSTIIIEQSMTLDYKNKIQFLLLQIANHSSSREGTRSQLDSCLRALTQAHVVHLVFLLLQLWWFYSKEVFFFCFVLPDKDIWC